MAFLNGAGTPGCTLLMRDRVGTRSVWTDPELQCWQI